MIYTNYVSIQITPEDESLLKKLHTIIELKNTSKVNNYWRHDITDTDSFTQIVSFLYEAVGEKLPKLYALGIKKEDLYIYWEIRYEGQCNFEIYPETLSLLTAMNVSLGITCFTLDE